MISPPINLGQEGLTLSVRLYFQAQGEPPELQGSGSATVTELEDGDYYVEGDDPPAGSTAAAMIFETGIPALVMYTYSYGAAAPSSSIVWRHAVAPVSPTQRIVQNDTYGALSLVVTDGLPEEIGDGGTAATFTLYNATTGDVLIQSEPAVISNVTEDGGGNGFGCTLTYTIRAGNTDTRGSYRGRFAITYAGSLGTQTVPADDSMRVEIVADYDAP